MSRKQIYLEELQDDFNSERNLDFIIDEVFKNIIAFKKVNIIEDDFFNDVFNDISTKVFNYEARGPNQIDLIDLNEIVIRQLTDYINENIEEFDTKPIVYKKQSKQQHSQLVREQRRERGLSVSESSSDKESEEEYEQKETSSRNGRTYNNERNVRTYNNERNNVNNRSIKKKNFETDNFLDEVVERKSIKPKIKNKTKKITETKNKSNDKIQDKTKKIRNKQNSFTIEEKPHNKPTQGTIIINDKLNVLNLDLSENHTNIFLDNVKSIRLKLVDIINSDYIITENNNSFSFKIMIQPLIDLTDPLQKIIYSEDYNIIIEPGNYTKESLLNTIQNSMNEIDICNSEFKITFNQFNDFVTIQNSKCNFTLLEGPLLNKLGFSEINIESKIIDTEFSCITAKNIFDLRKRRKLPISIGINDTESIIDEIVYLNDSRILYHFENIIKVYNNPITLDSIYIDFDNYNFRGLPFFVKLEILYLD